jgi:hypothetical protein
MDIITHLLSIRIQRCSFCSDEYVWNFTNKLHYFDRNSSGKCILIVSLITQKIAIRLLCGGIMFP